MGIKGIYQEIGPGERVSLTKLAVQIFEKTGRPLRVAIDISIWLFQIQAGRGGKSPALRTFYYRLLRLISCSIHPLFVFDGPNKPPFKRNKRTGPNVASIPEYLARDLLKRFGLPFHQAPGEAEADCALLQQKGVVDAVLSEDVDTLMFGSGLTFRNWSGEGTSSKKVPTHVNVYDAQKTKSGKSGLDKQGMILVALMSGGDYIPEGIPGCGSKTACEAARAGFGTDLCNLDRKDQLNITSWKEKLSHELRTNESKFFKQRHIALTIPDDFPRMDILRYYTHPCVSTLDQVEQLRRSIKWDQPFDVPALRQFTAEAFEWLYLGGAKKFIRNLAPTLLIRELRLYGQGGGFVSDDTHEIAQREARLVRHIFKQRNHADTDGTTELQVGFFPIDLVPIDLSVETPDPVNVDMLGDDSDHDAVVVASDPNDGIHVSCSPKKLRGPPTYDPTALEKVWILETYVKVGVPLKIEDWKETFQNAEKYERQKAASKRAAQEKRKLKAQGGMPKGALDKFTKVTKPGIRGPTTTKAPQQISESELPLDKPQSSNEDQSPGEELNCAMRVKPKSPPLSVPLESSSISLPVFRLPAQISPSPPKKSSPAVIEIYSSPESQPKPKKRYLRRSQSESLPLSGNSIYKVDQSRFVGDASPQIPHISQMGMGLLPNSVATRRPRSPLRRTHTVSTDHSMSAHQSANSSSSQLRALKSLTNPPSIIRPGPFTTPTKRKPNTAVAASPKQVQSQLEIIEIGSSPASLRTPQTGQTLITDFLPRSGRTRSTSPKRSRSKTNMRTTALSAITEPPSPSPKPRQNTMCTKAPPTFKIPLILQDDTMLGTLKDSRSSMDVIRLRESLDGVWGLGIAGNAADTGPGIVLGSTSTSRGRKRGRGAQREWRISQVEVLDLTKG